MKTTVNFCDFTDAFRAYDRQDSYSYEGKKALFDWFEQYEDDCGEEVELDVIAICCDFTEYESAVECINDAGYGFTPEPFECPECGVVTYGNSRQCEEDDCKYLATKEEHQDYIDNHEEEALEYLNDNTFVIEFDGGIIIQAF